MKESGFHELRAAAAWRKLSSAEASRAEAWIEAHPEYKVQWSEERELTSLLHRLGNVPVASSFTAQVMAAVERETRMRAPRPQPAWRRLFRFPGFTWQAGAALVVAAVVWSLQVHQDRRRAELAESLEALPVAHFADVDVWRDFDCVNALAADTGLSVDKLTEALR